MRRLSEPERMSSSSLQIPNSGWRRRKSLVSTWRKRWRYYYRRFVSLQGSPKAIARGLACGVFTGFFPIFGFQIVFGVALATLLRGNKIAAAAGTWISNPLTSIPIFIFNFQIGTWLLNDRQNTLSLSDLQTFEQFAHLKEEILASLFVGSLAMGSFCGLCSYFIGLWVIRRFRRFRHAHSPKHSTPHSKP